MNAFGNGGMTKVEREIRREYGAVGRSNWEFCQKWAAGLSDKDLRAAKRLGIPDHAGLAVDQEHGRRFNRYTMRGAS